MLGTNEGLEFEVVLDNGTTVRQKINPTSSWNAQLSRFNTEWILDGQTRTAYPPSRVREVRVVPIAPKE